MKLFCFLLVAFIQYSCGARILAVFPFPSKSHFLFSAVISNKLAQRGHHVTMIAPDFHDNSTHSDSSYNKIFYTFQRKNNLGKDGMFSYFKRSVFHRLVNQWNMGSQICEQVLSNPQVQKLIENESIYFDLILLQNFVSDCFFAFAHKFKAPVIQIMSMRSTTWLGHYVGTPNFYSVVPDWSLGFSHHMTFPQRLINMIVGLYVMIGRTWYYIPQQEAVMNKFFKECCSPLPPLSELEVRTSLVLVNSHFSLDYPRPIVPNWIQVAGLHLDTTRENKKLDFELHKFLNEASEGVIYFSLGTSLLVEKMPEEKLKAFISVFSSLKQRVIVKGNKEKFSPLPNVMIREWFPQSLILAHQNTRLFITQGGLLSIQESIFNGVPILGIPIFGDQESNMKLIEESGCGITLDYEKISHDYIYVAVEEVLLDDRYGENARRLSKLFQDRPLKPIDEAVFWVEYVIRHNGATHMHSASLELSWYQFLLLDVCFTFILIIFVILWTFTLLVRNLYRYFCRKLSHIQEEKHKTS